MNKKILDLMRTGKTFQNMHPNFLNLDVFYEEKRRARITKKANSIADKLGNNLLLNSRMEFNKFITGGGRITDDQYTGLN